MNKKKELTHCDLERFADRPDEMNPTYLFSLTATQLLVEALREEFDVNYLIRKELANRGMNRAGVWIGFEQSRKELNIEKK